MRYAAVSIMLCGLAVPLAAQRVVTPAQPGTPASVAPPDSMQMAQMLAMNLRPPTRFVLDHRQKLGLTDQQLASLAALEPALKDSARVRVERMTKASTASTSAPDRMAALKPLMYWEGPIDEEAIRKQSCSTAEATAEAMIGLVHDRVAVGAILTPEQRKMLPTLNASDMMKVMKPR